MIFDSGHSSNHLELSRKTNLRYSKKSKLVNCTRNASNRVTDIKPCIKLSSVSSIFYDHSVIFQFWHRWWLFPFILCLPSLRAISNYSVYASCVFVWRQKLKFAKEEKTQCSIDKSSVSKKQWHQQQLKIMYVLVYNFFAHTFDFDFDYLLILL